MDTNITQRVRDYWTVRTRDFSAVRQNELRDAVSGRHHNQSASQVKPGDVYGHIGVTPDLQRASDEITLAMPASLHRRPAWDFSLAEAAGFSACGADEGAGTRILRQNDLSDAPLFLFWAKK